MTAATDTHAALLDRFVRLEQELFHEQAEALRLEYALARARANERRARSATVNASLIAGCMALVAAIFGYLWWLA